MVSITVDKACCKGCNICLAVCPKKVLVKSKKRNNYGTTMPNISKIEECVVCRMCEKLCPDGAINVEGEYER